MFDTLLGVIIGGLIASITPIVMINSDHRRWQRQSTLEHLRSWIFLKVLTSQNFNGFFDHP